MIVYLVYISLSLEYNIVYFWKKKIMMILEHLQNFVRKTTSGSRRCCNVNVRSENRRRKHDVVTTLVFGRSNGVRSTTLRQRYPMSRPKYNQNLTLLQRLVPVGTNAKLLADDTSLFYYTYDSHRLLQIILKMNQK